MGDLDPEREWVKFRVLCDVHMGMSGPGALGALSASPWPSPSQCSCL